ncbi:GNAT family N-acetyltransferase [Embleya sp. NBC_00896]|uniref:GNAT family N-acetyltransferase n=1 Tax=Embleya sp. NBC_00896 TaxID=2975961 RepID=UPI00386E0B13|nr:GNAT family N-acetyltransferase [Embleya sp. NBC_00896]
MSSEPRPELVLPAAVALTGHGIHLREWTDDDLPALVALFDDVEIARWTPLASPYDAEAARDHLAKARRIRGEHRGIQLAVTLDGVEPRGEVLLFVSTDGLDAPGQVELAYGIAAAHRGLGLATRSVRLMTEYAYHELGATAVILHIPADNAASIGVARATGFERTDTPPIVRDRRGTPIALDMWLHRAVPPGA